MFLVEKGVFSEAVQSTEITPNKSGYWSDEGNYASNYAGGNGTEGDPYQIATPKQFALFSKQVNNATCVVDGVSLYPTTPTSQIHCTNYTYFELVSNINLADYYWVPIGDFSSEKINTQAVLHAFQGSFDGNGYKITGMILTGSYAYAGLFGAVKAIGYIEETKLSNINLEESYIKINRSGPSNIGGLVSRVWGRNLFLNCLIDVKILYETSQNEDCYSYSLSIGGLVGGNLPVTSSSDLYTYGTTVTISNCITKGEINVEENIAAGTSDGLNLNWMDWNVGIGGIMGSKVSMGGVYASNCANFIDINCVLGYHSQVKVGGVFGDLNAGYITNCFNYGDINIQKQEDAIQKYILIGGFVDGLGRGYIKGSCAESDIEVGIIGSERNSIGCFIGYTNSGNIEVSQCYYKGRANGSNLKLFRGGYNSGTYRCTNCYVKVITTSQYWYGDGLGQWTTGELGTGCYYEVKQTISNQTTIYKKCYGDFSSIYWFYHDKFKDGEVTLKEIYWIGKNIEVDCLTQLKELGYSVV